MPSGADADASVIALARTAMANAHAALAGDDRTAALRWLDRAHRLVPHDPNTALTLASLLVVSEPAQAAALFEQVTRQYDVRQAWMGLAAARLRLGACDQAAAALGVALSQYAFAGDVTLLAAQVRAAVGAEGWCALRPDGGLEIQANVPSRVRLWLDGQSLPRPALPAGWERARRIDVRAGERDLIGSPIQIAAIRRLAGCVEVCDGGVRGWAWHPGDPATAPRLTLQYASSGMERVILATDEAAAIADTGPLARPRRFALPQTALDAPGPIHIRGPDGNDLPGSPLDPAARQAVHLPAAVSQPVRSVAARRRQPAVTVVVSAQDDAGTMLPCLTRLLATIATSARLVVVDDAASDPALATALDRLRQQGRITLLRHPRPLGFPASANAGIQATGRRDVALLQGAVWVPRGWLDRLRAAAYSANDIGIAAPLSAAGGMLGYAAERLSVSASSTGRDGAAPPLGRAATDTVDRTAARANRTAVVDMPGGADCCVYLRRDCLDAIGPFRADVFAQGGFEHDELVLRACCGGWRAVAVPGLIVSPATSEQPTHSRHLRDRNSHIVEHLHPGQAARRAVCVAADPLALSRRRIDALRWRQRGRNWRNAVVLITHDAGGGVEQRVRVAAGTHAASGRRPIVLRPAVTGSGDPAIRVDDAASAVSPDLIYAMPGELPDLLHLLRAARPDWIEAHHLAFHPPAIYALIARLGVPYDVHVHDYAWFCPRLSLVAASNRYCGEPDLPGCETCIATNGHFLREDISVGSLRQRSARFLAAAHTVVVPSDDTANRMRRHFIGLPTTTVPHEDDAAICKLAAQPMRRRAPVNVCVVGAIGVHKGFDVLFGCARDAADRDLPLRFTVVGHSIDDAALMATGRVFVTGRFDPLEAVALIVRQASRLAFLPSVWPETWCLALGDIWRAGLAAVAFDFGAPAERIRRTGGGMLLPVGLPTHAINDALLAVAHRPLGPAIDP